MARKLDNNFFSFFDEIKSEPNYPKIGKGTFGKNEKTNSQEQEFTGRRLYREKFYKEDKKKALQEEDIRGI